MAEKYVSVPALREMLDIPANGDCDKCAHHKYYGCYNAELVRACEAIDEAPEADVWPVEHGEWTYIAHVPFGHDYECSFCKQRNYEKSNFCPNCGAVMRNNPVIIGLDMGGETNGN